MKDIRNSLKVLEEKKKLVENCASIMLQKVWRGHTGKEKSK